jgi:hypothetical protein
MYMSILTHVYHHCLPIAGSAELSGAKLCENCPLALLCLIRSDMLGFAYAEQAIYTWILQRGTFQGGAGYPWKPQRPANPDRRADFTAAEMRNGSTAHRTGD